jgi:hypothetical protein
MGSKYPLLSNFLLWATLLFLTLMLLANLVMAYIATFAIPCQIESRVYYINNLMETRIRYVNSPHDPPITLANICQGNVRHGILQIPKKLFFSMTVLFSSFLLVLGFLKSFTLLGFFRKSLLKFLLQEPVESVDYWTREENVAHGRRIDRLCTNVLLCFISLYFTVIVFQHFHGNLPTTAYSGKPMYSILDIVNLCLLTSIMFLVHSSILAEAKLKREQNKRYRLNFFLVLFVVVCVQILLRNLLLTFSPSSSCC